MFKPRSHNYIHKQWVYDPRVTRNGINILKDFLPFIMGFIYFLSINLAFTRNSISCTKIISTVIMQIWLQHGQGGCLPGSPKSSKFSGPVLNPLVTSFSTSQKRTKSK